jgi:hypothetical protein
MSVNKNDVTKPGATKSALPLYLSIVLVVVVIAIGIAYIMSVQPPKSSTIVVSQTSSHNSTSNTNSTTKSNSTSKPTTTVFASPNATGYIYCIGTRAAVPHNQTHYAPLYANGSIGQWENTTTYPYYRYGMACFDYNNSQVFCWPAGKALPLNTSFNLKVIYHASLTANGIGNWIATTPYPIPKSETLCAPYNNHIYCVGAGDIVGNFGSMPNINGTLSYYSTISSNGIGNWTPTTPYPVPLFAAGCWSQAPYNGYLYCTGNGYHNATVGTTYENRTYHAQILQNGSLGQWKLISSTFPAVASGGCFSYNDTYYCFGPIVGKGTLTYYAKILSNHTLGPWNQSEALPEQHQAVPCVLNNYTGYVYCLGNGYGLVLNSTPVTATSVPAGVSLTNRTLAYYGKLTPQGMQNWTETTHYPVPLAYAMCITKQMRTKT